MWNRIIFCWLFILTLVGCKDEESPPEFVLTAAYVGATSLSLSGVTQNVPVEQSIVLVFSSSVNAASAQNSISLLYRGSTVSITTTLIDNDKSLQITPVTKLENNSDYTLNVAETLHGAQGQPFPGKQIQFKTVNAALVLESVKINGEVITATERIADAPLLAVFELNFSNGMNTEAAESSISIVGVPKENLQFEFSNDNETVTISNTTPFSGLTRYALRITNTLSGENGETFGGYEKEFYTTKDDILKFPLISDEELLTLLQQQTFKYFWDFAEPSSGMARERNTSGELVTSGGSGFGLMAIIVAIERGFISRSEGLARFDKILSFLQSADRFHGAWSHWINGSTGKVIPFSPDDNGGDLVETSFLIQGLLTVRQYLDENLPAELALIDRINALWHSVEWDWYTKGGEAVLYWHWSPDKDWIMNHQIRGHNETLITYVLAASSPTHTIDLPVYHEGYARNGDIRNGKTFYGITLPLGEDYGGPLFFSHYSFLGLDPRNLKDAYADYWIQNTNHSLINYQYCISNPKNWIGYSDEAWGLTASDNQMGYSAHSPANDLGVITPTAALSSFPYTPVESMKALKFFYYNLGDRLWGDYGFYDSFNLTQAWTASSYLAIDQGPIIVMVENYRTGLLWNLFMSAPEVQSGLMKLGFTY